MGPKITTKVKSDVVVVGAGPAGLASCREALLANKSVLLIDVGENLQQPYASTQFDARYLGQPTGGFGGAARLWGAQSGFLDALTLSKWKLISSLDEKSINSLMSAKNQMNKFLDINVMDDNFYEVNSEQKLRTILKKYSLELRHTTFPKKVDLRLHWVQLMKSNKIEMLLNETLYKIEHRQHGETILVFESGLKIDLGMSKLIIAAGTISTTGIILRSFPLESQEFNVGKQLLDHPCGVIASYDGRGNKDLAQGLILKSKFGILKRKFQYQTGDVSGIFEIQYDLSPKTSSYRDRLTSIANRIGHVLSKKILFAPSKLHVWVQIEQTSGNSVYLDKFDNLVTSWSCSKKDLRTFEKISIVANELLTSEGFKLEHSKPLSEFEPLQAFHPSSTIPMHSTMGKGFVNEFGIVHSHPNILIASAAIFPTAGWINPTFLIMTFASHGTKHFLLN